MSWPVQESVSLGRGRRAAIRLSDPRISAEHASVEPRAGGFLIRDAGSRHGTFLNGTHVGREGALASAGSLIRAGDTLLMCVNDVEKYRTPPRRIATPGLGSSERMIAGPLLAEVWDQAARAGQHGDPVLIVGESGSGKECVARILHAARASPGPFVGINVTAIPKQLFEAELYGHERGAFTGATLSRPGAFREASGGVLFLDEVDGLELEVQSKLLRALDRGEIRPLGANRHVSVEARIVSATNANLREACEAGTFRPDLYYRLSGVTIRVPPLFERPDDIVLLILEMKRERSSELELSADAVERLVTTRFEGNVRQLRAALSHALDRATSAGARQLTTEHLPALEPVAAPRGELTLERIRSAMKRNGGVAVRAAEALGVSRTALYKAMKRLGADLSSFRDS
ncbi:MAG TPA: sigma 54-interacting transcriptional regulator [Polyangiaceae bacterium]